MRVVSPSSPSVSKKGEQSGRCSRNSPPLFLGNNSLENCSLGLGGFSDRVHDMRGQGLNKGKEAFRQILSNK